MKARVLPHYKLDQARVIISFGADFLGTWISPVEFTTAWSKQRAPTEEHPEIGKAQRELGNALLGLRRIDEAIRCFEKVVELFELARYSLHPLDEAAKQTAMTHLETIQSYLEWEVALASQA